MAKKIIGKIDQAEWIKQEMGNVSKKQTLEFLTALEKLIATAIQDGKHIRLNNIGTLKTVDVAGRYHRNPNTGEKIYKGPHKKMKFIPSDELKELI